MDKRRYMEGRIPLDRLVNPEDFVGPIPFLAVDATGPALRIAGGMFGNLQ